MSACPRCGQESTMPFHTCNGSRSLAAPSGSGKSTATKLSKPEYCCEIVGTNRFPGRYLAHGCRPCRAIAQWVIAGKYYCTKHAKARYAIFPNRPRSATGEQPMSADFTKSEMQSEPPVRCIELVVPLGKRAVRREAKLKAASVLQNLIMDGEFEESAKPLIWSFIDKLRAQIGKRHNDGGQL